MTRLRWKYVILGIVFFLIFSSSPSALAQQGRVSPFSVSVTRGQSFVVQLTYSFTNIDPNYRRVNSGRGRFLLGGRELGRNSRPLSAALRNRSGSVSETLVIPQHVIERSFKARSATFRYRRVFTSTSIDPADPILTFTPDVTIRIVSGATATFSLRRVELYFKNKRGQITVPRNYPDLKAFADIRFNGSGLLTGYWQVDRKILKSFAKHVTFGREITLETPKIPALPTYETGYHIVRLVITRPQPLRTMPEIAYYVTSEMFEPPVGGRIDLLSPQKEALLPFAPALFRWRKLPVIHVYLIEFREEEEQKPLFSALTKEPSYTISSPALPYFMPEKPLLWSVKGFDKKGKILAESGTRIFRFQSE